MPRPSHHSSFLVPRIFAKMHNLRNLQFTRPFRLPRGVKWVLALLGCYAFQKVSYRHFGTTYQLYPQKSSSPKYKKLPIVLLRSPTKVEIFPGPYFRISTISVLPEGQWFFPWGPLTP